MDRAAGAHGHLLIGRSRGKKDRELEVGATAHFEDPAYYEATYASRTEDVAFYVRASRGHEAILEYGIGSGRIAIPIARSGVEVIGVDHSRPMVFELRRRLAREPADVARRVRARVGDMRSVRTGRRFSLVTCPFNAALHLYERRDVERWLARVKEHLTPRGELLFDVSTPMPEDLARDPTKPHRTPPFVHPTLGRVKYHEYFDYDRVRQILFVSMCFEPASGGKKGEGHMTPLAQRQFFPQELEALLHYNGFDVLDVYGDFDGHPFTGSSETMIWRARATKRSR